MSRSSLLCYRSLFIASVRMRPPPRLSPGLLLAIKSCSRSWSRLALWASESRKSLARLFCMASRSLMRFLRAWISCFSRSPKCRPYDLKQAPMTSSTGCSNDSVCYSYIFMTKARTSSITRLLLWLSYSASSFVSSISSVTSSLKFSIL